MNRYLKAGIITLFIGLGFVSLFQFWSQRSEVSASQADIERIDSFENNGIPQISFKEYNGAKVEISQFKGKVLIVSFWASWCGPCLEEMPSLISLIESQKGNVELIAISADYSKEDLESFFKSYPKIMSQNIHVVWDEDSSLARSFAVDRLPESFVVGKDQKLVKKIVGSINWHTEESMAFMSALSAK